MSTNFFFKSLLTRPGNVLPLHLKQTFPPIIWIFTEGEGDGWDQIQAIFLNLFYFTNNFYNLHVTEMCFFSMWMVSHWEVCPNNLSKKKMQQKTFEQNHQTKWENKKIGFYGYYKYKDGQVPTELIKFLTYFFKAQIILDCC